MKTLIKSLHYTKLNRIVLIAFFFLPWIFVSADDYTKTYQKKYDVEKGANLIIQNKFGDIQCQAWDENNVSILVTVTVEASSQDKADKVFGKIDVSLTGSNTKVQGITSVESVNNADFSINYEIRMPRWINIDFDNRFGDIYLDETDGLAKINLEYGAMEAGAFNGQKTEFIIKFSDAEAGYIKDASLSLEYSEWESKGAENLTLYSRFSEIAVGKVSKLNLDSQYDEVNIDVSGTVIAVSRFSELDFARINGDFDFDIQYGELNVDYISADFKQGKIRNTFAEADLTFDPKASMTLDAEIKFGELSYPRSKASMNEEKIGYTTHVYKGRLGASANPSSELSLISKNADVDISFAD